MCAALTDSHALNFCAACRAGFSFTIIHAKMILEFTAAIDPIDGGAIAANAFLQHLADRVPQRLSLFRRYGIGGCQRMQFRDIQGFISVHVAKQGKKGQEEQ